MILLARFIIVAIAVGYIDYVAVYSLIAEKPRRAINLLSLSDYAWVAWAGRHLTQMLSCPFCTGFWVAVATQAFLQYDFLDRGVLGILFSVPALAMPGAFIALYAGRATKAAKRGNADVAMEAEQS